MNEFPEFEGLYLRHEIRRLEEKKGNSSEFSLMITIWAIKPRLSFLSYLNVSFSKKENGWADANSG